MTTKSSGLECAIYHCRYFPHTYAFNHKIFYIALNLKDISSFSRMIFFSINARNLLSINTNDYGYFSVNSFKEHVYFAFNQKKISHESIEDIVLLTIPRTLGYLFNPVSFWLCFNKNKKLCAVLSEVNNKVGGKHTYLSFKKDLSEILPTDTLIQEKIFYVSPFFEIKGDYNFVFNITKDFISIKIQYFIDDKLFLTTSLNGKRKPFNTILILKLLIVYPFNTIKVSFFIFYHAFRLWMKKISYFKHKNDTIPPIS